MFDWISIGGRALVSGSVASAVSTGALALIARTEGRRAVQPLNATSHWIHGERAGYTRKADMRHTLTGYATHHASAVLWAFVFETLRSARRKNDAVSIAGDAAAVSALAAVVDYGIIPRRLSPGWETVVSPRGVAGGFAALALGLALGGMATRPAHA